MSLLQSPPIQFAVVAFFKMKTTELMFRKKQKKKENLLSVSRPLQLWPYLYICHLQKTKNAAAQHRTKACFLSWSYIVVTELFDAHISGERHLSWKMSYCKDIFTKNRQKAFELHRGMLQRYKLYLERKEKACRCCEITHWFTAQNVAVSKMLIRALK